MTRPTIRSYDELFSKLMHSARIKEIAIEYTQNYENNFDEMNIQLTDMIFKCCKIPSFLPVTVIKNNNFNDINVFLSDLYKQAKISTKAISNFDISFDKCWSNLLLFFENIISLNWNILSNNCKFNSYFIKFLTLLGKERINSLRHFSIMIRLKFISVLINKSEIFIEHRKMIHHYAVETLNYSYYDIDRYIWEYTLKEFEKWFTFNDDFLTKKYFNFIIQSLKDKSIKIVLVALDISGKLVYLLNRDSYSALCFTNQLAETCSFLLKTSNFKIFENTCECFHSLYKIFDNKISTSDFFVELLENIFTEDLIRAKMAAKFTVNLYFDKNSKIDNIYAVVKLLLNKNSFCVALLVEALINYLDILTDWNLLTGLLFDRIENKQKFSASEKETLLSIMLCVIEQVVIQRHRSLRFDRVTSTTQKNHETSVYCKQISKEITISFGSFLKDSVLILNGTNGLRSQILLMKIITFLDFDSMNYEEVKTLIITCIFTIEKPCQTICTMKVATELLINIMQHSLNENILAYCREITPIEQLKSYLQTQFARIINNVLEYPELFMQRDNIQQEIISKIVGLFVLNLVVSLDKEYTFYKSIKILDYELTPWNCIFLVIREISIRLGQMYTIRRLKDTKEKLKEGDVNMLTKVEEELQCSLILLRKLNIQINFYFQGRLGLPIFFTLCEIAIMFFQYYPIQHFQAIFPIKIKDRMAAYVAITICNMKENCSNIEISTFDQKYVLIKYLQLISLNILSLNYSYDILDAYCKHGDNLEDPLHTFLVTISKKRDAEEIARWLLALLIIKFECAINKSDFTCLKSLAKKLAHLIFGIKKELENVICLIHIYGIDYATIRIDNSFVEFLYLLAEFSICLDKTSKVIVHNYLLEKQAINVKIMRYYLNSLKNPFKLRSFQFTEELIDSLDTIEFSNKHITSPRISLSNYNE